MVAQMYINDPLLLDGKKFDLRIYVVVTGINEGQMHAFIADEGLARFCTETYEQPNKDNFSKAYMHLTNYSLNKDSEEYVKDPEDILEPNNGSKRTLTALYKQLEKQEGSDLIVRELKESIERTCSGVLVMLTNMI